MANTKIEKVKKQIGKTKEIISDYQAKLRVMEKQKIDLENNEIIALYRRESLSEDEFSALIHATQRTKELSGCIIPVGEKIKEDTANDFTEN
jgi:predicted DNA-binding protein YlxM (UPF0122 family)